MLKELVQNGIEAEKSACSIIHDWQEELKADSPEGHADLLRTTIRHVVLEEHIVGDKKCGGFTEDRSLSYKLSLVFFQRLGLLKYVAPIYEGDMNSILLFVWPEGLPNVNGAALKESSKNNKEEKIDALSQLFQDMRKFPLLNTPEQEKILAEHIRAKKSLQDLACDSRFVSTIKPEEIGKLFYALQVSDSVLDLMVNCNLRLIPGFVREYQGRGFSLGELINEGALGLMTAAERYDPEKGARFSTYAYFWVRQRASYHVQKLGKQVHLPSYLGNACKQVVELREEFEIISGRTPTEEELKAFMEERTGLKASTIKRSLETIYSGVGKTAVSLNMKVGKDDSNELGDFIADKRETAEFIERKAEQDELQEVIDDALEKLRPSDRIITELRFGLGRQSPMTLEAVGNKVGLTRERVRQRVQSVLYKLARDANLKSYWETDPPSYFYGRSAEKAAFRAGLFDDRRNIINGVSGIPTKKEVKNIIAVAIRDGLWPRVSVLSRVVLNLYLREKEDGIENIAEALDMPRKEIEKTLITTFNYLRS